MDVSVIIPTYNNPITLSRAIDSALDQKGNIYYNIIVVDDNDPFSRPRAETEQVMEKYKGNEKVIYIKHSKNLNGAAARNTGVKNSTAKYIAFLDDDDVFLSDKLRLQYEYMEEHAEFDASYTWRIQGKGEVITYNKTGDLTKEILLLDFFPTTVTLMIKRDCYIELGGFDESYKRHQDFEFLIRFFEKYKIGVVPKALSRIIGKATIGNQLRGKDYESLKAKFLSTFDHVINRLEKETPGIKKRIYANHFSDVFVSELSSGMFQLACRTFFKGIIKYKIWFVKRTVQHYFVAIKRKII